MKTKLFIMLLCIICSCNGKKENTKEVTETDQVTESKEDMEPVTVNGIVFSKAKPGIFEDHFAVEQQLKDFFAWYAPYTDTLTLETGYAPDEDNDMYIKGKQSYIDALRESGFFIPELVDTIELIYNHCDSYIYEGIMEDPRIDCLDGGDPIYIGLTKKEDLQVKFEALRKVDFNNDIIVDLKVLYDKITHGRTSNIINKNSFTLKKVEGDWLISSTSEFERFVEDFGRFLKE